ncbi:MAG: formylglycine-generating enzyme family protein [Ginsengibacter sp.]
MHIHEKITLTIAGSLISLLMPALLFAQQDAARSYTQKIEGTTLQFDLVAIPGGEFAMGSMPGEQGRSMDEGPLHTVKIDPFWMGKYEVTWDIFEPYVYKNLELTKSNGVVSPQVDAVTRPTKPYLDMTFGMGKEGYPAVGMTQYNAIQFCKWLYARTGLFYRLPTEAEWEYACRAGSSTSYSFGNDTAKLGDYAWYIANSKGKTQPVGQKKPNAWGLYDMHGNVMEWTIDQYIPDFYEQFNNKVADNPVATPVKLYPNTVRGGSFGDSAPDLRSAKRIGSDPRWKRIDPQAPKSNWWFPEGSFVGMRLVSPVTAPSKEEIAAYYDRKPIADY